MVRTFFFTIACLIGAGSAASAQAPAPAPMLAEAVDSTAPAAVTSFAVKSGKIALSTATSTKPIFLPDGAYTNEGGTVIVIVEGVINRVERTAGEATFIENVRLNKDHQIMLTPGTTALMQVSDMRLPSGTFRSADGKASFSVIQGRPTSFTVPGNTPEQ